MIPRFEIVESGFNVPFLCRELLSHAIRCSGKAHAGRAAADAGAKLLAEWHVVMPTNYTRAGVCYYPRRAEVVRCRVTSAVCIHRRRLDRGQQTTDTIDVFLLQRTSRAAELSDELTAHPIHKAQIL